MLDQLADGRTDLVFDHLAGGGQATDTDAHGTTLLQWCAYYGDVSAIRYLLQHGASLDELGHNRGLMAAVFHGHWPLCQFLLEQGADVNAANEETGETPLHAALNAPNRPAFDLIVRLLLAHGANPTAATLPGQETGSFMRDARTRGETPLHRAAAFASEAAIQMLLDAGANPEALDAHGDTPLSWASWHIRPDAILRLLCYGPHTIHPARHSTNDHGRGWGAMELYLKGQPHL